MQPARCTKSGRVTNVRANATHWEKSPASSLVWNGLIYQRPTRTPVSLVVVTETSPLACRRGASTVFSHDFAESPGAAISIKFFHVKRNKNEKH
jgi:hypothetical protein